MHLDLAASSGPLPLDRVDICGPSGFGLGGQSPSDQGGQSPSDHPRDGFRGGVDITCVWSTILALLLRGKTDEVQEELCRSLADRGVLEEHDEIRIRLK